MALGEHRYCSQAQHAQAQHWLRYLQAQLMHAQAQPSLVSPRKPRPPPPWTDEVRLSLSMNELSQSMPEPMLILSMLILATYPEAAVDVTTRTHRQI